jgi:hypothetical protein
LEVRSALLAQRFFFSTCTFSGDGAPPPPPGVASSEVAPPPGVRSALLAPRSFFSACTCSTSSLGRFQIFCCRRKCTLDVLELQTNEFFMQGQGVLVLGQRSCALVDFFMPFGVYADLCYLL